MSSSAAIEPDVRPTVDEAPYYAFLNAMQERFQALTQGPPLFTSSVTGEELWTLYLEHIPEAHRQHYNCHTCRHFIQRFGNLVMVGDGGNSHTVIWVTCETPPELKAAIHALHLAVESAPVSGVFLSSEKCWGTPRTPDPKSGTVWEHFCLLPTPAHIYREGVLTAAQRRAELREDFRCLQLALTEFKPEVLAQARTILEADALARAEKFLSVVTWLQERHADWKVRNLQQRSNRLWRAVATAPAGFCKPRSSMVGTLLEDLRAGMAFEDVKRRFDAKLHPLQYQRPQAPPTAGNIQQAEAAFAKLGLEPALQRRLATLDDVLAWVWQPQPPTEKPTRAGIFGHLKPKGIFELPPLQLPEKTLTWVKFRAEILPTAARLELRLTGRSTNFYAYATAVDPEAPPLLQWDREAARNPVSWYTYAFGSPPNQWGLTDGWHSIPGVTLKPSQWQEGFAHHGEGVLFILEDCRDTRNQSLALFPEALRSELHGVRATIEAHSQSGKLLPSTGQLASGLLFQKGQPWTDCHLRVTTSSETIALYHLDRWD